MIRKQKDLSSYNLTVRSLEILEDVNSPALESIRTESATANQTAQIVTQGFASLLSEFISDSVLSTVEKKEIKRAWYSIYAEYPIVRQRALTAGYPTTQTQVVAYKDAYDALNAGLNGASGVLVDMTTSSTIVPADFKALFDNYDSAKEGLVSKISAITFAGIITGGVSGIKWDATGTVPTPSSVSPAFSAALTVDTFDVSAGCTFAWSCYGQLTGTGANQTFTPSISNPGINDPLPTGVICDITYNGVTTRVIQSVTAIKAYAGIPWIADWDGAAVKTTYDAGRPYILAAGVYAGTVEADPDNPGYNRVAQGVFMGKGRVNGITGDFFGLVAIQNGAITFKLDGATGAATFGGALSAPTGTIGGFTLGPSKMTYGNKTSFSDDANSGLFIGPTGIAFGVISSTSGFSVDPDGSVIAKKIRANLQSCVIDQVSAGTLTVKEDSDVSEKYVIFNSQSNTYILKSLQFSASGTVRVTYTGKVNTPANGYFYAAKNASNCESGSPHHTDSDYATYTFDLAVTAGDIFSIVGVNTSGAITFYTKDFSLKIAETPGILKFLGMDHDTGTIVTYSTIGVTEESDVDIDRYPLFVDSISGSQAIKADSGFKYNSHTGLMSLGALTTIGDLIVGGNLTVNGTVTTINSTELTVDDKNITLGSVATPTDTTADGGGITLKGATDKTIIWDSANANWTLNQDVNIPTGKAFKINNVSVLNATTLGSSVVDSSLTSLGVLKTLTINTTSSYAVYRSLEIIKAHGDYGVVRIVHLGTAGGGGAFEGAPTLYIEDQRSAGFTTGYVPSVWIRRSDTFAGSNIFQIDAYSVASALAVDYLGAVSAQSSITAYGQILGRKTGGGAAFYVPGYSGLAQYVGNWASLAYWGIGPATNVYDNKIRIGMVGGDGSWNSTLTHLMVGNIIPSCYAGSETFTSGSLGSGWRVDYNNTFANKSYMEVDNLLVRDTLRTHVFEKNVIRVTNGQLYISDSMVIADDYSGDNTDGTIYVDADKSATASVGQRFQIKEVVMGDGSLTVCSTYFDIVSVGALSGGKQAYTITRVAGADYFSYIKKGMTAARISGGNLLADAVTANSPFLDVRYNYLTKARLGNLSGITSPTWGQLSGWGLWSDNVYLEGSIKATSGFIADWSIAGGGLFATGMGIYGGTYPYIWFYDQGSGTDYITIGRHLYDGAWHDDWNGAIFRYNAQNWFQMYSSGDGATRVAQIAGWNFDGEKICNNSVGYLIPNRAGGVCMSTTNSGSGYFYTGAQKLAGFSIFTDTPATAYTLVMGQMMDTGASIRSGYFGLQLMSHDSKEFFALGHNSSGSPYNRIAGWAFDNTALYTGTKVASGSFAAAGEITIGSDGHISANQFRVDTDGSAYFKGAITGGSLAVSVTAGNNIIKYLPFGISYTQGMSETFVPCSWGFDGGTASRRIKYRVPFSGTVRVNGTLKTNDGSKTVYGRVYKNGSAVGTENSTTSTSGSSFYDDISVSEGDVLELYVKMPSYGAVWEGATNFWLSIAEAPGILKYLNYE